jgi:hypothetical protein
VRLEAAPPAFQALPAAAPVAALGVQEGAAMGVEAAPEVQASAVALPAAVPNLLTKARGEAVVILRVLAAPAAKPARAAAVPQAPAQPAPVARTVLALAVREAQVTQAPQVLEAAKAIWAA